MKRYMVSHLCHTYVTHMSRLCNHLAVKGSQKASKREAFGGSFGDISRKPEKCDFGDPSPVLGRSRGQNCRLFRILFRDFFQDAFGRLTWRSFGHSQRYTCYSLFTHFLFTCVTLATHRSQLGSHWAKRLPKGFQTGGLWRSIWGYFSKTRKV